MEAVRKIVGRGGVDLNESAAKLKGEVPDGYDWSAPGNASLKTLRKLDNLDYELTGWTPLMEAAEAGQDRMVELLLEAGADKTLTNSLGKTAYDIARENARPYLMVLLR